jgi:16S rRNA (uracil1498-N3)-methyltransferase
VSVPVFLHPSVGATQVGDAVQLNGPEGRHAVSALRIAVGEAVDLVDGSGTRAQGIVESISGRDTCTVRIGALSTQEEPAIRFIVAQALLKGEHDERAIDLLTEVGVDEIIPLQTDRCVVRWNADRAQRGQARWASASGAAARQCRRARWPVIHAPHDVRGVAELCREVDIALLLDPQATTAIGDLQLPPTGNVLILVGPEGGFSKVESDLLEAQGVKPIRLGVEILRGSAAGFAAVAACSAATRWRS